MSIKDWVPITISVVSLLVSATTAFFSVLRQVDDISLALDERPSISLVGNESIEVPDKDFSLVFLNAGNRPAAIIEVGVVLVQRPWESYEGCRKIRSEDDTDEMLGYSYQKLNIEPFTVKEKDIVTRRAKLTNFDPIPIDADHRGDVTQIYLCLVVFLTTPRREVVEAYDTLDIELTNKKIYHIERPSGVFMSASGPHKLIHETSFVFDID